MSPVPAPTPTSFMRPLEGFDVLQSRYQALGLAGRAQEVLKDAEPALQAAEHVLNLLSEHPSSKKLFTGLRGNSLLIGKMRASEAKNMLMDASCDFIEGTRHKLAAWRKTIERLGSGEAIMSEGGKEFIPGHAPLALALIGNACVSNYLSIIQLAFAELAKTDSTYSATISEIRRCATVLSDCEVASGIDKLVH